MIRVPELEANQFLFGGSKSRLIHALSGDMLIMGTWWTAEYLSTLLRDIFYSQIGTNYT
jgi:hypothetical protein